MGGGSRIKAKSFSDPLLVVQSKAGLALSFARFSTLELGTFFFFPLPLPAGAVWRHTEGERKRGRGRKRYCAYWSCTWLESSWSIHSTYLLGRLVPHQPNSTATSEFPVLRSWAGGANRKFRTTWPPGGAGDPQGSLLWWWWLLLLLLLYTVHWCRSI